MTRPGARSTNTEGGFWRSFSLRAVFPGTFMSDDTAAALSLLNAAAVRTRAKRMLALGLDDKLPHFRIDLGALDHAVDLVAATTRKNYPMLDVPFHSRWRHFVVSGSDRAEIPFRQPDRPRRTGARGLRSRHRQRVARCRRRTAMALSRCRDGRKHRPLRGTRACEPRHVRARRLLFRGEPEPTARRCQSRVTQCRRRRSYARVSDRPGKYACRPGRPRRTVACAG